MIYRHLFGPVNSRRLGISLGVDMVKLKTCSLNCIYCECGPTTDLTLERREYVSGDEIIEELGDYLGNSPRLDYVTLGGSGEPTLNTATGRILRFVKERFSTYRTALLTNGTLFHLPEVREEVAACDLVLPSLDAVSDDAFAKVNRPHGTLSNELIIDGLATFTASFRGQVWLEVFIVPGVNDSDEELRRFKDAIGRIAPSRVQLNSLDRPGAVDWIRSAERQRLREIADYLLPLPVEIISRKGSDNAPQPPVPADREQLLSLLGRRPLTIEEISPAVGKTINETRSFLTVLQAENLVATHVVNGRVFYRSV